MGQHGMYEIYGSTVEDDEEIFDQLAEQCNYSKDYSKEDFLIVNFVLEEDEKG